MEENPAPSGSLMVHPRPFRFEGAPGYLLRLAFENGLSPKSIFSEAGGIQPQYCLSRWHRKCYTEAISRFAGIDECEALLMLAYVDRSVEHELMYSVLDDSRFNTLLSYGKPRFCPSCLQNNGYWRKSWDFSIVTSCLEHQCFLLDHCPRCHVVLEWDSVELFRCSSCQHDLRESNTIPVPKEHVTLTPLAEKAIFGPSCAVTDDFEEFAKELDIESLTLLFIGLGLIRSNQFRRPVAKRDLKRLTNYELAMLSMQMAPILKKWSLGPYEYLCEYVGGFAPPACHTTDVAELHRLWNGVSHAEISFPLMREINEEMRELYNQHLSSSDSFDMKRSRVSVPNIPNKMMSSQEVMRLLDCSEKELSLLTSEAILRGTSDEVTGAFAPEAVREARAFLEHLVPWEDALRILDIKAPTLKALARDGIVRVWGESQGAREGTLVRMDDIATLFESLERIAKPYHELVLGSLMDQVDAGQLVPLKGERGAAILRLVLDGKANEALKVEDGLGLSQYFFPMGVLKEISEALKEEMAFIDTHDACEILGTNEAVVLSLAKAGLIDSRKSKSKTRKVLISESSCERFLDEYVFARELAARWDIDVQGVPARLAQLGIFPSFGPQIDGVRVYVFLRKDTVSLTKEGLLATSLNSRVKKAAVGMDRTGLISLRKAARKLGVRPTDLLRATEMGLLHVVEFNATYGNLYREEEIEALEEDVVTNPDLFSETEAIDRLVPGGRFQDLLRRWVSRGKLKVLDKGIGRYFLREEVEECLKDKELLVTAKELVELLGIQGLEKKRIAVLRKQGRLVAVSGPEIDGCGVHLYPRSQTLSEVRLIILNGGLDEAG